MKGERLGVKLDWAALQLRLLQKLGRGGDCVEVASKIEWYWQRMFGMRRQLLFWVAMVVTVAVVAETGKRWRKRGCSGEGRVN